MEEFDSKCNTNFLGDEHGGVRNGSKEDGSDESDKGEDGKEAAEILMYNETYEYLSNNCYPPNATKAEKGIIKKLAKNFRVINGILHYRGKNGPRQVCLSLICII